MPRSIPIVTLVLVGAASLWSAAAQNPAPFRAAVRLVEVDVVATNGEGEAVRDLTEDDFEILEDGRPQSIQTFAFVDVPPAAALFDVASVGRAVEPDVTTNAFSEGRLYVLLLDAPSTAYPRSTLLSGYSYTMRAKQVAQQFIDTAMQPGDQVAVVHVQGTFTDSQPFTTSRRLVEASIERYGRGRSGVDSLAGGWDNLTRNLDTYRTIEDLAGRLGAIRGRRKAIIWIGGQIDIALERKGGTTAAAAATLSVAYRDAMRAAARNNVAIYPVDPSGATPALGEDDLMRIAGLRAVAEDTGGLAVVNTSNFLAGFEAIIRDLSAYYLLGYSPDREHRGGTFHSVQVRVKRPGVTVRARRGYYAGAAPASSRPSRAALPTGVTLAAAEALARPVPTPGVQIDVTISPFRAGRGESSVILAAHVDSRDLRSDPGASLALAYQIFDLEGRLLTGAYKVFGLNLQPENRAIATDGGFAFIERVALRPGRYELRLVAEQPNVGLGSVIAPVHVPEFEEPLSMSGLVLAIQPSTAVALASDVELRAALGDEPTVRRQFRRSERLSVFAEVYTDARDAGQNITASATITSSAGMTVTDVIAQPVPTRGNTAGQAFRADFDLPGVPPGSYVLTLEARSSRYRDRTATRQIPFTIIN